MRNTRLAFAAAVLGIAATVNAAAITWTGAVGTDFSTAGNWAGGKAPANGDYGDIATFTSNSPSNQTPNIASGRSVQGLDFRDSAGWTLSGAQLILRTVSSTGPGNNSVSAPLKTAQYANAWNIGSGNTLLLTGGLYQDGDASKTLTVSGGGTLAITGQIGGWSSGLILNVNDATVRISAATPYASGGKVYLKSSDSHLQLQTSVANATALIGSKIIDSTGSGLQVTDAGGGYALISVPEPAALGLLVIAAVGLAGRCRLSPE